MNFTDSVKVHQHNKAVFNNSYGTLLKARSDKKNKISSMSKYKCKKWLTDYEPISTIPKTITFQKNKKCISFKNIN